MSERLHSNSSYLPYFQLQVFSASASRTPGAQLVLSSATFPRDLDTILSGVVDTDNLLHVTSSNLHRLQPHVAQKFLRLSETDKPERLLSLVRADVRDGRAVLIFARDQSRADRVGRFLGDCALNCARLHGRMDGTQRRSDLERFCAGHLPVMVATDVASRGLDTANVRLNLIGQRHIRTLHSD